MILAVVAAALLDAAMARAHVVVGRRSLRSWTRDASVVVVADVVAPVHAWVSEDGRERRDAVRLRVVETLRGDAGAREILVHPHAEGLPDWPAGSRVIAFLEPSAGHALFAPFAASLPWFTTQGPEDAWGVAPEDEDTLRLARAWTVAGPSASPGEVRHLLLAQLRTSNRRLREDALLELVVARRDPRLFVSRVDVAPFARLAGMQSPLPVPERIALQRALDGVTGFDSAAAFRDLVRASPAYPSRDRLALVRAAGPSRDPEVSRWLAGILDDASGDPSLRREAAAALGRPWHASQAPALERASRSTDPVLARRATASLAEVRRAPRPDRNGRTPVPAQNGSE